MGAHLCCCSPPAASWQSDFQPQLVVSSTQLQNAPAHKFNHIPTVQHTHTHTEVVCTLCQRKCLACNSNVLLWQSEAEEGKGKRGRAFLRAAKIASRLCCGINQFLYMLPLQHQHPSGFIHFNCRTEKSTLMQAEKRREAEGRKVLLPALCVCVCIC